MATKKVRLTKESTRTRRQREQRNEKDRKRRAFRKAGAETPNMKAARVVQEVLADAGMSAHVLDSERATDDGSERIFNILRGTKIHDGDPGDETPERSIIDAVLPHATAPDPQKLGFLEFETDTPPVFIANVKTVADAFAVETDAIVSPFLARAMKRASIEDLFTAYIDEQRRKTAEANSRAQNEAAARIEAIVESEKRIADGEANRRNARVAELHETAAQFFGRAS